MNVWIELRSANRRMGKKLGIVSWTLSLTFLLIWLTDSVLSDVPPVIREAPREQIVRAGGTAAFLCITTGDPTPHITWRKNGNKISLSTSRYQIDEFPSGSLLRIEPVRKERDENEFECVAENGVGDQVTATAKLEVYYDKNLPPGFPTILKNPSMKVVEKGRNAILECEAAGEPQVRKSTE